MTKAIPDFPGYKISDTGVLTHGRRILKLSASANGSPVVQLRQRGVPTTLRIARLVGAAFCPDYQPELRVRFLDGNTANCAAANLTWVSRSLVTGIPYSKTPRKQHA